MATNFYYRINDENDTNFFKKFNVEKENLIRNNNRAKFHKGEWTHIQINDFIKHIVKPTETLEDIAKKYDISVEKIVKDNELQTHKLFIGKCLKICI